MQQAAPAIRSKSVKSSTATLARGRFGRFLDVLVVECQSLPSKRKMDVFSGRQGHRLRFG
jgi:hypothetical protein